MSEREARRRDPSALIHQLEQAGAVVLSSNRIRCPFHDDQHPSGGVFYTPKGVCKYKCHGCGFHGDIYDVQAKAEGKSLSEVLPRSPEAPKGKQSHQSSGRAPLVLPSIDAVRQRYPDITHVYTYTNPDTGQPDLFVFRRQLADGKKSFLQAHPTLEGIVLKAPEQPLPLYACGHIRRADFIVVVEGEKCVHALHAIGITATTNPGGAGKAKYADWSPLAGKRVYLWPDNDPVDAKGRRTGIDHMREVADILATLDPPAQVFWIDFDQLGLPPKGDVVDFLDAMTGTDRAAKYRAVMDVLARAVPIGPAQQVRTVIENIIAGLHTTIALPWSHTTRLTQALRPGTITILCGDPGCGKSLLLLEALIFWLLLGIKIAVYELEDGRSYHLMRALAQQANDARVVDEDWVRAHPDEVRRLHDQHRDFLDSFGRCIHDAPDTLPKLTPDLTDWIERMAVAGCRVIAIDPITIADVSQHRYLDDQHFMAEAKRIVERYGTSLVLVTHPRKNHDGTTMDDVAGGTAYTRFAQTVLWYEKHEPAKNMRVTSPTAFGTVTDDMPINRTLAICKARNATGAGLKIAFHFENHTLRSAECGIVVKRKQNKADEQDILPAIESA